MGKNTSKKINKFNLLKIGSVLILSLLFAVFLAPKSIESVGTTRPCWNCEPGDEELARLSNMTRGDVAWQDPITAKAGDSIQFLVYYHNTEPGTIAENTRIQVYFPTTYQNPIISSVYLLADNADTIQDTATIELDSSQRLVFDANALWYPEGTGGDSHHIPVSIHGNYAEVNLGGIPGCWEYTGYVIFKADLTYTTPTPPPTVDIKADGSDGPIVINYGNSALLSWESRNASSCQASGGWSGTKGISGVETTGSLTVSKTYTITCTGLGGTASDSVTVSVSAINRPPVADAGPNKEVYEYESVVIQGSGYDPDGDSITYSWYCSGGSLSSASVAQPVFYAPSVSGDRRYTCTLTVTDSHAASDSDSMEVLVKEHESPDLSVSLAADPSSGCVPLDDVDLKASVSGSATGSMTYLFDCQNNGTWEKIYTSSATTYTAYNLCSYSSEGDYKAKVRVEREGLAAEDTVSIYAYSCDKDLSKLSISKKVKNLTKGHTSWYNAITASPSEKLAFKIEVTSKGDFKAYDVIVKDILPDKISWYGNLEIDGKDSSDDITTEINVGDLSPGKSKTITFEALLASKDNFPYGTTDLVNTALTFNPDAADTDTAKISVTRTGVAGDITDIPTGVLGSAKISLLIAILITFLVSYALLLKSYVSEKMTGFSFRGLISETRERVQDFLLGLYLSPEEKSRKQLSQVITGIKEQEGVE